MRHAVYGFSLIEVLIALIMTTITLSSIIGLQSTLQKIIFKDRMRWQAEQAAFSFLTDIEKNEPMQPGKTSEQEMDGFKIVLNTSQVSGQGPLADVKNIICQKITVSWKTMIGTDALTLVRFLYSPETPKGSSKEKL